MATEQQYNYFKLLYDEESERTTSLKATAKQIFSLSSLYTAFAVYVTHDAGPQTPLQKALFGLFLLTILGAFLLALLALQIADFEGVAGPRDVIDRFPADAPMTDSRFFDGAIGDFTVATERNSKINDAKAAKLSWAGRFVLAAIVVHGLYFWVGLSIPTSSESRAPSVSVTETRDPPPPCPAVCQDSSKPKGASR